MRSRKVNKRKTNLSVLFMGTVKCTEIEKMYVDCGSKKKCCYEPIPMFKVLSGYGVGPVDSPMGIGVEYSIPFLLGRPGFRPGAKYRIFIEEIRGSKP